MAISRYVDLTYNYKVNNLYSVNVDLAGWDRTTIHVEPPIQGTIYVYGSNDAGDVQGITEGNAKLATSFSPIQAVNLATGGLVSSIVSAGVYKVDANARFLQISGGAGTNIGRLLLLHTKID
jgi:hypothetical protein